MTAGWPSLVKYFSPVTDSLLRDPDGTRMDVLLMQTLDAWREKVGSPFHVTSGYRSQDLQDELLAGGKTQTKLSAHTLGKAVDGYFKKTPIWQAFLDAIRYNFKGVGLYPFTIPPIIHVDIHDRGEKVKALWIVTADQRYLYAPSPEFYSSLRSVL